MNAKRNNELIPVVSSSFLPQKTAPITLTTSTDRILNDSPRSEAEIVRILIIGKYPNMDG